MSRVRSPSSWTGTAAGPGGATFPLPPGHRAGTRALRRTVEAAIDLGVESLCVYAFSTENWSRPPDEVDALMEIFIETIERELPELAREGVRTRFIGRRDRATPALRATIERLEEETATNERLQLWVAFDYGGRAEIVEAVRRLVEEGVDPRDIDENAIASRLYAPEMPEPDLLIRTSGELRISNFLLWQLAYTELVFVDTLWPDFGERQLRRGARRVREPPPALRRPVSEPAPQPDRRGRGGSAACALRGLLRRWALFALAAFAALLALHELYQMARSLRPLVLAGYGGALARRARRLARRARVDARRLHGHDPARVRLRRRLGDAPVHDRGGRNDGPRRGLDRPRPRPPHPRARPRPATGGSILITVLITVFVADTLAYSGVGSPAATRWRPRCRPARPGRASSSGSSAACSRPGSPSTRSRSRSTAGRRSSSAASIVLAAVARRSLRVAGQARPRRQGLRPRPPRPRRGPRPRRLPLFAGPAATTPARSADLGQALAQPACYDSPYTGA